MSATEHTPGPWNKYIPQLHRPGHVELQILGHAEGRCVCCLYADQDKSEEIKKMSANGRLIAAAPQLLDTLHKIEVQLSSGIYLTDPDMQKVMLSAARTAIADATGGAA